MTDMWEVFQVFVSMLLIGGYGHGSFRFLSIVRAPPKFGGVCFPEHKIRLTAKLYDHSITAITLNLSQLGGRQRR